MGIALAVVLALFLVTPATAAEAPPRFEPTANYARQNLRGWKVLVARDLRDKYKDLGDRVFDLLGVKLAEVDHMLPAAAVEKLRDVPIWVEYRDRDFRGMCYHPSRQWLSEHGFNPEKAGGVEIGNTENFLSWSRHQPSMVLHELAHAYHHRFLGGYDNPEIVAAFRRARDSKTYDSVLYYDGNQKRAYAMTDPQEYFAELTEAWFGTNDFYPFVRPEARQHDPEMAKLLEKLWGK